MQPRRLAFPVLAILLGLVGGAALVEIGLRISGTTPDTVLRMIYAPSGPFESIQEPPFFGYKKNFQGNQVYFACDGQDCAPDMELSFRTSSMRMRGHTHNVENPADNWRVLILGDSFSVADGVPEQAAWPQVLGDALGEAMPKREVEVINTSMQAYSTLDQWHVLQRAIRFEPDVIVVGIYLNDAMPSTTNWSVRGLSRSDQPAKWSAYQTKTGPLGPWLPPLTAEERSLTPDAGLDHEHFIGNVRRQRQFDQPLYILRWASTLSSGKQGRQETIAAIRTWWGPWNTLGKLEFNWSIRQIGRAGIARRIPVVAALFPWMDGLKEPYPFHEIHSQIQEALDEAGIPYVDLLESFQAAAAEGTELWAHPTDHHPSAELHAVAATSVFPLIQPQE